MKKILIIAVISLFGIVIPLQSIASAASTNYNNLIDDAVFDNTSTMNSAGIDAFLNRFPNSCISTNSGFQSVDPIGYSPSTKYRYGGNVSAGTVINDAAQAYGLNPQVILTTLQKEQGLVLGNGYYGCGALALSASMGYNCPDSGPIQNFSGIILGTRNGNPIGLSPDQQTCVKNSAYVGFSRQIISAAWQLSFDRHRSEGQNSWYINKANWDNSDDLSFCYSQRMVEGGPFALCPDRINNSPSLRYSGLYTISGIGTAHMDNGATAALYNYTPHKQSFTDIFAGWFGSSYGLAFNSSFVSLSTPTPLLPGQTGGVVSIQYRNTGSTFWKDDTSNYPGYYPIHLAITNPINKESPLATSEWLNKGRPSGTFSNVYESDGVTLAADQHTVNPGQIARFDFHIVVPFGTPAGTYRENIQPVAEGAPNWVMGGWGYFDVTVQPATFNAGFVSLTSPPALKSGQTGAVAIRYKNIGSTFWKDDTSNYPGYHPTHFAVTNPINRESRFASAGWLNLGRPNGNFSKVYESDGVTLTADQHTVWPGQIEEYDFNVTVPAGTPPGTYRENIQPVVEGAPNWVMGGWGYFDVTVQP